jgi:hypothetical protein
VGADAIGTTFLRRALAVATAVGAVALIAVDTTASPTDVSPAKAKAKAHRPHEWCGARKAVDRVCRESGKVSVDGRALARRKATAAPPEAVVRAEAGAIARITFKRQALCQLGLTDGPTEIQTRFGGSTRLYRQTDGVSWCTFADDETSLLPFFCEPDGTCPVIVKTDGSVIVHTSNPIVTVVCAGSFHVRVTDANGLAEASGSASEAGRIRITVHQTEDSIELEVDSVHGRGACASAVFRRQARALAAVRAQASRKP